MSGMLYLWVAYRSLDVVYFMNLINAATFLLLGTVSLLIPALTFLAIGLESYLNYLLRVHGINEDNMDDLL